MNDSHTVGVNISKGEYNWAFVGALAIINFTFIVWIICEYLKAKNTNSSVSETLRSNNTSTAVNKPLARDEKTFHKITEELLPSYAIDFMRSQSFGSSYSYESIKIFFDFREHKTNPKLRFVNPELETLKVNLFDTIISLIDILVVNTSMHNKSVVLPHTSFKNNRDKINEVHKLADNVCKLYDELIEKSFANGL